MSKKLVTEKEIVDFIIKEVRNNDCKEFEMSHINRLRELNPNGCNWSEVVISRNSQGFQDVVNEAVYKAQKLFNLK